MSHSHCGDCPAITEETQIRQVQRRFGGNVRIASKTIITQCVRVYLCFTAQGDYSELRHDGPRESNRVSLFPHYFRTGSGNLKLNSLSLSLSLCQAQPPPADSEGYNRVNRNPVRQTFTLDLGTCLRFSQNGLSAHAAIINVRALRTCIQLKLNGIRNNLPIQCT